MAPATLRYVEQKQLGLRERKKAAVRAALVRRSLDLFEQYGYENVTVEEIADAAGVSRATFFRYFEFKCDVLFFDEADATTALVDLVAHRTDTEQTLAALTEPLVQLAKRFAGSPEARRRSQLIFSARSLESRSLQTRRVISHALAIQLASERRSRTASFDELLLADLAVACYLAAVRRWQQRRTASLPNLTREAFERCRCFAAGPT